LNSYIGTLSLRNHATDQKAVVLRIVHTEDLDRVTRAVHRIPQSENNTGWNCIGRLLERNMGHRAGNCIADFLARHSLEAGFQLLPRDIERIEQPYHPGAVVQG
jgi:hypothetical protein